MSDHVGSRCPTVPLRIGMIGYGTIARTHHRVLHDRSDVDVVAVAKPGDSPTMEFPAAHHPDHRALLERDDIDLVVICSPSGDHASQAAACLEAGKHVVVEKPLTLDVDAGCQAVQRAQQSGLLLSVISQRRFEPQNVILKQVIGDGRLGRPVIGEVLVRWFRDQEYYDATRWRGTAAGDGGVLINQAIHAVDLLRWFMGPVEKVSGVTTTRTHRIEAEDTAVATLCFASGALGALTATTSARPGLAAEINLFFEHGCVTMHDDRIIRWDVDFAPRPPDTSAEAGSGAASATGITLLGHRRQWDDIIDSLHHGSPPAVTGHDALGSAALVLAIYESGRTGAPVHPTVP